MNVAYSFHSIGWGFSFSFENKGIKAVSKLCFSFDYQGVFSTFGNIENINPFQQRFDAPKIFSVKLWILIQWVDKLTYANQHCKYTFQSLKYCRKTISWKIWSHFSIQLFDWKYKQSRRLDGFKVSFHNDSKQIVFSNPYYCWAYMLQLVYSISKNVVVLSLIIRILESDSESKQSIASLALKIIVAERVEILRGQLFEREILQIKNVQKTTE